MMKVTIVLLCFLFSYVEPEGFCQKEGSCQVESPRITTKLGVIIGNRITFNNTDVNEFLGIPFAESPTGNLRFKAPVPITEPWVEPLTATRYQPSCLQSNKKKAGKKTSEDCLYLNIWTPVMRLTDAPKSVMVFIHGGSFNMGTASTKDSNGTVLTAMGDVIIVTVNYRLGFFGFLNSDADTFNAGIKDQLTAVTWVRDNIESFGGDPHQITLFGHSAGAISVGIHVMSPESRNLFKRAIIQSGVPHPFLRPDSLETAKRKSLNLSKFVNCSESSETELSSQGLECLRQLNESIILSYGVNEKTHSKILPNPMFGDSILPESTPIMLDRLSELNETKVELIIGFQKDEGELFIRSQLPLIFKSKKAIDFTVNFTREIMTQLLTGKLTTDEQTKVWNTYFSHEMMTSDQLKEAIFHSYGDLYVYCSTHYFSQKLQQNRKIYLYSLESKATKPVYKGCTGICHGEELPYVFGLPLLHPLKYSDSDRQVSRRIINMWSDFAKTG